MTLQANKDKACSHFQNSTDTNSVEFQKPLKADNDVGCSIVAL